MALEQIKNQYKRYQSALEVSERLRANWPAAKKRILKTLKHIKNEVELDAKVKLEDKMEGMEIIYLTFGRSNSGIFEKIGKARRPVIKEGGHLFYSQLFTGKIGVWRTLPHVKKLSNAQEPMKVGVYDPDGITEDLILQHVHEFIESVADWEENDLSSNSIGYKLHKK
ncbi:MAG: hypothetical protein KJP00_12590 [Bacteroidia bacterium]|nr:hypothetical protein [Bacteroidia bacterium]